jgi:hypothetical protein
MQTDFQKEFPVTANGAGTFGGLHDVRRRAFTLLEVMVACAIFFMVAFALLELVTRGLVGVRALQEREPDPGIILAMYSTNKAWEPMQISGNYEDIAPDMYPGYTWELFATPHMETNEHLYVVEVMSYGSKKSGRGPSTASTMFFSPNSKPITGLGGVR